MSFYGNSYQYLAETFAHIILKNAGLENIQFPTPTTEQIDISAEQAESGVNIFSGNRWIVLNPYYDNQDINTPKGLEIWHNSPSADGTLTSVVTEVPESVSSEIATVSTLLDFDKYIKVPVLTYDQAGHCLAKDEAIYYKMPSDPSGPFYERLWKVDGINPEGEEEEPEGGSLKRKILDRMTSIDGCDDTGTPIENEEKSLKYQLTTQMTELDEKVETWDDMATAAEESAKKAAADAQSAKDSAQQITTRVNNIEKSFNTLKNTDFENLKAELKSVKEEFNEIKTEDLLSLLRNLNALSDRVTALEKK